MPEKSEKEKSMISQKTIEEAMYEAMRTAALEMPPDVRAALERALAEEKDPMAQEHLKISLKKPPMASWALLFFTPQIKWLWQTIQTQTLFAADMYTKFFRLMIS